MQIGTVSTLPNLQASHAEQKCACADALGAWGSDVGGEEDSEDSVSSGSLSGADIVEAMQDGLSLQERYPVQSAQDVRGTWTPLQASGRASDILCAQMIGLLHAPHLSCVSIAWLAVETSCVSGWSALAGLQPGLLVEQIRCLIAMCIVWASSHSF